MHHRLFNLKFFCHSKLPNKLQVYILVTKCIEFENLAILREGVYSLITNQHPLEASFPFVFEIYSDTVLGAVP